MPTKGVAADVTLNFRALTLGVNWLIVSHNPCIAHFALRNNEFPKIEAGGGPEAKEWP